MIYTTLGPTSGCCGHRHEDPYTAGLCLKEYREQVQSPGGRRPVSLCDRRVVAVEDNATWSNGSPLTARWPNDDELKNLYSHP